MRTRCCLLHIRPEGLQAFKYQQRHLEKLGEFTADVSGHASFSHFLTERAADDFLLLADTDDESNEIESIPHVGHRERKALIQRKMASLFPDIPFRTSISLGRQKTPAIREKILFSALARPEHLSPWIACLTKADAALRGIYSPGQLDAHLLNDIPGQGDTRLIVICQGKSLRQSLVQAGRRQFSRTTYLPPGEPEEQAISIVEESRKLAQYLVTQAMLPSVENLATVIIAPPELATALSTTFQDMPPHWSSALILEDTEIARATGGCKEEANWVEIYLTLLARHRPRAQFASRELMESRHQKERWKFMLMLSFSLLLASIAFATVASMQVWSWRQEGQSAHREAVDAEARYARIARTFPTLDIPASTLGALIEEQDRLLSARQQIDEALIPLSQTVSQYPAIQLSKIEWLATGQNPPTLLIDGEILPGEGGKREARDHFDAFIKALTEHTHLSATTLLPPFDFISTGRMATNPSGAENAPFKLRLNQRAEPKAP